jgi:hypothetical protein
LKNQKQKPLKNMTKTSVKINWRRDNMPIRRKGNLKPKKEQKYLPTDSE